ncbi:MAG: protein kinase domain-containing protein [Gemmatimonadales bacterium]
MAHDPSVATRACPTCDSRLPADAAYCAQCGSPTHTQIIGEPEGGSRTDASYEAEPERLQQILGPQFDLGRLIGRGGYAEVFSVYDRKLQRELAIKVLRPDLIVTPSLLARFRREALAVAALQHPAIVPVYDVGETEGVCYILMPLVRGESLKALLLRQGRLPLEEVQRIVLEAANALAAAHDAGIVHRDIKPENIMLEGPDRHVRLMDFGIAKAVDSGDKELTGTGVIVGTPQYMSPEQATGEPAIDQRSDQYSLGVVAYQMLSGRAPFEGETARAIMTKQLLDQPPALEGLVDNLPAHMAAALHRAMQKNPLDRFDHIKAFAQALQDPSYRNPASLTVATPRAGVRRWAAWAGAATVAAAVVVIATQLRGPAAASESLAPVTSVDTVRIMTPAVADPPADPRQVNDVPPQQPAPPPPAARADSTPRSVAISPPATRTDTTPVAPPPPALPTLSCVALVDRREWDRAATQCIEEAEGGNARAARLAAELLAQGRGSLAVDEVRAAAFYEQAAQGGDAPAQFLVARRSERTDPSHATAMYLAAANGGHEPAFAPLANRLYSGLGTARDFEAAASWFRRAGEAGDVTSLVRLGEMYLQGQGVTRSEADAAGWYRRAAERGQPEAQYQMAQFYFRGRGVERSDSEGLVWLRRAAEAGHAEAKRELERRS